jgi:hypothetical protein
MHVGVAIAASPSTVTRTGMGWESVTRAMLLVLRHRGVIRETRTLLAMEIAAKGGEIAQAVWRKPTLPILLTLHLRLTAFATLALIPICRPRNKKPRFRGAL